MRETGPCDGARDGLAIAEFAQYLESSKSTLYDLARWERIPGQKVGKHWRFRKDAIDRWLERIPDIRSSRRGEEDA